LLGHHLDVTVFGIPPHVYWDMASWTVTGGVTYDIMELMFDSLGISRTWQLDFTWLNVDENNVPTGGAIGQARITKIVANIVYF